VAGAFSLTPSSRMSLKTPTTSRQVPFAYGRIRLPIAAGGEPQSSRAMFSETMATARRSYVSSHMKSRPATSDPPIVFMKPGATNLNIRSGGICDSV